MAARLKFDLQHAFYLFSSGYVKTGEQHRENRAYYHSET